MLWWKWCNLHFLRLMYEYSAQERCDIEEMLNLPGSICTLYICHSVFSRVETRLWMALWLYSHSIQRRFFSFDWLVNKSQSQFSSPSHHSIEPGYVTVTRQCFYLTKGLCLYWNNICDLWNIQWYTTQKHWMSQQGDYEIPLDWS